MFEDWVWRPTANIFNTPYHVADYLTLAPPQRSLLQLPHAWAVIRRPKARERLANLWNYLQSKIYAKILPGVKIAKAHLIIIYIP